MADETYGLALPFDTDSPEFARGVEIGRLWEQLKGSGAERDPNTASYIVEQVIHAENAEMALRLAEATGWIVQSDELDDDWISVTFLSAETPEEQ